MTAEDRLTVAKLNLQRLDNSADDLIKHFLQASDLFLQSEGVVDDETEEYDYLVIMYACYLFRKRDASPANDRMFGGHGETGMPRFLRWAINNVIMKQKGSAES